MLERNTLILARSAVVGLEKRKRRLLREKMRKVNNENKIHARAFEKFEICTLFTESLLL